MKKLIPIILIVFSHNIILSQNSIPFKYLNKFYDEINFEEYENNKTKFSDFGNSIKINRDNIKKNDSINIKSKIEFSSKNKRYLVLKFKEISQNAKIDFLCFENNSKYVDINKLKPLAKDLDGNLNIFKLADIIEKNKASLSKYLDQ